MIAIIMSSAIVVMGMQASISAPRTAFVACLKEAGSKAESQNVAVDAYEAFLASACAAQAASLKSALVAFDVKNGIKKAAAETDAQAQIDDYHAIAREKYENKKNLGKPNS